MPRASARGRGGGRQSWTIVGNAVICAKQSQVAAISFTPQHFGCGVPCRTAAHDDDVLWHFRRADPQRFLCGHLVAHEELAVARLNLPAGHRVKRRRAERLSRAKTETSVMPQGQQTVSPTRMPVARAAPWCVQIAPNAKWPSPRRATRIGSPLA
jgi:hypothetical protein